MIRRVVRPLLCRPRPRAPRCRVNLPHRHSVHALFPSRMSQHEASEGGATSAFCLLLLCAISCRSEAEPRQTFGFLTNATPTTSSQPTANTCSILGTARWKTLSSRRRSNTASNQRSGGQAMAMRPQLRRTCMALRESRPRAPSSPSSTSWDCPRGAGPARARARTRQGESASDSARVWRTGVPAGPRRPGSDRASLMQDVWGSVTDFALGELERRSARG